MFLTNFFFSLDGNYPSKIRQKLWHLLNFTWYFVFPCKSWEIIGTLEEQLETAINTQILIICSDLRKNKLIPRDQESSNILPNVSLQGETFDKLMHSRHSSHMLPHYTYYNLSLGETHEYISKFTLCSIKLIHNEETTGDGCIS